ncbi:MAG: LysE family translocator [Alphaproteobacteria bacterium]|nr:LysE family translocator [Rhizobiaceae bacterium]MBU3961319.1 LysE family translocator [Alphaproteobacteria bacterium]MBU4052201.1 LysE family translocator [Alphaproteobacteria bacterium]MBU4087545.1 LysE family translocator [Alphaproteobacteria bacterium]MBU4157662.1 LysE family translocator [Alphaproteobacteria bacterium]
MSLHAILWFIPACFALNMAFGPNNLLALTNGMRWGVGVALAASLARIAAFAIMIVITALGLGALLTTSEVAFSAIKWAGAAYLVWLGIKILRAGAPQIERETKVRPALSLKNLALQEFWVAIGNPKAILIFTAFFPQFLDAANYASSFTILGVVFLILEMIAITIYAMAGRRLARFTTGKSALGWVNRVSGSMMIAFGAMLALAQRPSM